VIDSPIKNPPFRNTARFLRGGTTPKLCEKERLREEKNAHRGAGRTPRGAEQKNNAKIK
jgi:hypothetical protein